MNDITALMASMKAAAEKAIEANERLCVMPPDEIFDVSLAHSKQLDADITVLNAHYNESTPANVKTLVEVLEAAEKTSAARKEAIERTHQMFQRARDRADAAEKRIAELESRTVTVKLPEPLMPAQHNSGELFMTTDNVIHGGYLNRDDVLRNLRAAGIQVIEGEE
ncbi:ead/Ea22-like family protein [Kluyvera intermedia]|uniref:ead/Ea22-like family protein n=1 Tax=Kluyvera intermedia TaxID=61648 RepID=UPI003B9ED192